MLSSEELHHLGVSAIDSGPVPQATAPLRANYAGLERRASERHRRGITEFEAAATHLISVLRPADAAVARHNLGYARFLQGDLVQALDQMALARQALAAIGPVVQAIGDRDRAEVLIAAGLVDEGQVALRAASGAFAVRRLHQRSGEARLTLARTLALTDPAAALSASLEARRLFTHADSYAWLVRADAVVLAAEIELGRRSEDLVARGDALVGSLSRQGLVWAAAAVRLRLARVMVRRDDLAGARARLAAVRVGRCAPLAVRLLARDVRAEFAARDGRRPQALRELRDGLRELGAWQGSFGSLDLQTLVGGHGGRVAARGLDLAVATGRPRVVLEWSERVRMVASRVAPVQAPVNRPGARDLAELRRMAPPGSGRPVAPGTLGEPCCPEELRDQLGRETALVAQVVTPSRIVALVVTDSALRVVDLGDRARLLALLGGLLPDLDVAASSEGLPRRVCRSVRAELRSRLGDLATLLVEPVGALVGERSVVLTSSGALAAVPWSLLEGFQGRPVTVARSATSWLARRTSPVRMRRAGFVAGPRVARAVDEVAAAARCWPDAEVVSGAGATVAAVADLATRCDVLHVAAHGRHAARNPMFSGLELVDGPLFGHDVDQLSQVPDVVLLSACEVGRSTVRYGEELIGMTTAWLHAGTRCVVASPAAVSDDVAHDVLVQVHAALGSGECPASALAGAVPAVSLTAPPAPFVCFG